MVIFPLTSTPESVFAPGQELWRLDVSGAILGEPVRIERSRAFHREWLLKFRGHDERDALDSWRGLFLGAPETRLAPPADGEVYLHELVGFAVAQEDGTPLGLVSNMFELPSGLMLEVQGPKREFLLPFKKEFIRQITRETRRLTVAVPDGLLD
jgi:16S rRNA processing protein RimM